MSVFVGEAVDRARPATSDTSERTLEARLARIELLLEGLSEDARRQRERWEALDELVAEAGPFVANAMSEVRSRLKRMEEKGYGEVLGASASVLDRAVQEFDADGVEELGENLLLLLRTLRRMS